MHRGWTAHWDLTRNSLFGTFIIDDWQKSPDLRGHNLHSVYAARSSTNVAFPLHR